MISNTLLLLWIRLQQPGASVGNLSEDEQFVWRRVGSQFVRQPSLVPQNHRHLWAYIERTVSIQLSFNLTSGLVMKCKVIQQAVVVDEAELEISPSWFPYRNRCSPPYSNLFVILIAFVPMFTTPKVRQFQEA